MRSAAAALIGLEASASTILGREPSERHVTRLEVAGAVIEISFDPDRFDLSAERIMAWVAKAAQAVAVYYGVFPVKKMRVRIESWDDQTGVFHGTTWGSKPPFTRIFVGRQTTQQQLDRDWMMTHEMVHTAFPDIADEHHWIEEGIATYVEPIARVQAGQLPAGKIWNDMVRGMPNGQPRAGDAGLDHTHTWGRTYWGGALFCLLADVQIRMVTQNKAGLQQALRGIQRAGGAIDAEWSIEKALAIGDTATQTGVLSMLYRQMKDKPVKIDLNSLWRNLGVTVNAGDDASFNTQAPWAATRLSLTSRLQS